MAECILEQLWHNDTEDLPFKTNVDPERILRVLVTQTVSERAKLRVRQWVLFDKWSADSPNHELHTKIYDVLGMKHL